jgi:hypothetical protein
MHPYNAEVYLAKSIRCVPHQMGLELPRMVGGGTKGRWSKGATERGDPEAPRVKLRRLEAGT